MKKMSLTAGAMLFCMAFPAQAQQTCLSRDVIVQKLGDRYSEQLVGRGLQGETRLFEIFMSRDGESWTIIQSYPSGISCVMAAGTNWQQDDVAQVFALEG